MVAIETLPKCAQRIIYGSMSRAVIDTLCGNGAHVNPNASFDQKIYDRWSGSDEIIKPSVKNEFDQPLKDRINKFKEHHEDIVKLFSKAETTFAPIRLEEKKLMKNTDSSIPFFMLELTSLPKFYETYFTKIFLREGSLFGELEIFDEDGDDDEDEDESDDDEINSADDDNHSCDSDEDEDEGEDEDGVAPPSNSDSDSEGAESSHSAEQSDEDSENGRDMGAETAEESEESESESGHEPEVILKARKKQRAS